MERVNFLNKFYQGFLCLQLPHKARKLVVVGDKDSGKSSWVNVYMGIMPESKIAIISKEKVFGTSMIADDTELLYIDEWSSEMLSSDMLKTILQGGHFAQSIKHKAPRMQNMQAGVFITCNNLPNFDEEDENVKRRLSVYKTKELPKKDGSAPKWIQDHAFQCVLWMCNVINCNIKLIDEDERFYERPKNISANARIPERLSEDDRTSLVHTSTKEILVVSEQMEIDDTVLAPVFKNNETGISD